jgi:hypothetical protein
MKDRQYYKIIITTIYVDDTSIESYLNGIYIDYDKAVKKADLIMESMLKDFNSPCEYSVIKNGSGKVRYQINTDFVEHPRIYSIWVEVEESGEILD